MVEGACDAKTAQAERRTVVVPTRREVGWMSPYRPKYGEKVEITSSGSVIARRDMERAIEVALLQLGNRCRASRVLLKMGDGTSFILTSIELPGCLVCLAATLCCRVLLNVGGHGTIPTMYGGRCQRQWDDLRNNVLGS